MIDLHCHILPGADDGPAILAESLAMARQAVADGIHTIVATPHGLGGAHGNSPETVTRAVQAFQADLVSHNLPIQLLPGCEVHLCPDMADRICNGEAVFLDPAKNYILIEFPFKNVSKAFSEEIKKLIKANITPVLAHPERNPISFKKPAILAEFISWGCLVQTNTTSILGGFGKTIQAGAERLISRDMVHIIASDAHSAGRRAPELSLAVAFTGKILADPAKAMAMVTEIPEMIINGQEVIPPPPSYR